MAERRMFAKTIIDSDAFLELPITAQLLYFHLSMRADDDGFCNKPRAIMNMIGAKNDDMKALRDNKFVIIFDNGVTVIKHWRIHNYIRKDPYSETKYKFEKSTLYLDENNAYSVNPQFRDESVTSPSTERQRAVNEPSTQDRLGNSKDSLNKKNIYISTDKNFSDFPENVENSAENPEMEFERRRAMAMEMAQKRAGGTA